MSAIFTVFVFLGNSQGNLSGFIAAIQGIMGTFLGFLGTLWLVVEKLDISLKRVVLCL